MAKSDQPISKWIWFLGLVMPIVFAAFLNYIAKLSPDYQAQKHTPTAHKTPAPPTYSFYQHLPKKQTRPLEDPLPTTTPSQKTPAPVDLKTTQSASTPTQSTAFSKQVERTIGQRIIQVGSYKAWKDADKKKAELALLGLSASIEKADIGNQRIWYRVTLGPFQTHDDLESTQQTLSLYDIPSLVRKKNI